MLEYEVKVKKDLSSGPGLLYLNTVLCLNMFHFWINDLVFPQLEFRPVETFRSTVVFFYRVMTSQTKHSHVCQINSVFCF